MFGGGTKDSLKNDLWKFDLSSKKYEKIIIENIKEVMQEREQFGMIYNEEKNILIVLGGRLYEQIDKNSYIINLTTKKCEVNKKMPTSLCSFAYTNIVYKEKEYCIIYGGANSQKILNTFIVYDIKDNVFYKSGLNINLNLVGGDLNMSIFLGRIRAMMCWNKENMSMIIYGGSAPDKEWTFINEIPIADIFKDLK